MTTAQMILTTATEKMTTPQAMVTTAERNVTTPADNSKISYKSYPSARKSFLFSS